MTRSRSVRGACPFGVPGRIVLLGLVALWAPELSAQAVDLEVDPAVADQFSVAVGVFDVLDPEDAVPAVELAFRAVDPWVWRIAPQVGAMLTSRGSVYGYGGFYVPVVIGPVFELRPSVGIGAYAPAEGLDLGHVVEFRSGVTMALRFPGGHVLSVFFYHLSNARLGARNPGTEVLGIGYGTSWR